MMFESSLNRYQPDSPEYKLAQEGIQWSKTWRKLHDDLPIDVNPEVVKHLQARSAENALVQRAISELRENPTSPDLITNYMRVRWKINNEVSGLAIIVPDCNWTEEEIKEPMKDIEGNLVPGMMVYHPKEIQGNDGLNLLPKIYRNISGSLYHRSDSVLVEDSGPFGWVKVEASNISPNLNVSEVELIEFARREGYVGQGLVLYNLASQNFKDLTGNLFDSEGTKSRLLKTRFQTKFSYRSRFGGLRHRQREGAIIAYSDVSGPGRDCFVKEFIDGTHPIQPIKPEDRSPQLGARFVLAK